MIMSDFLQSILKLNIKMRLYMWICTNFVETLADYISITVARIIIHIQKSESLIDELHGSWCMVIGMIVFI